MEAGTRKAELLATIEAEHTAWRALLEAIGEDRMPWPGAAGPEWTVPDVVAHLTAWRGRTIAHLQAGRQHTEPAAPPWPAEWDEKDQAGVGQINEWFYQADRGRPLAAVLAASEASGQALADLVRALPEVDLLEPGRFAWMDGASLGPTVLTYSFQPMYEHIHMLAIQAWRALTKC